MEEVEDGEGEGEGEGEPQPMSCLKLRRLAEFDTWGQFKEALEEFQEMTKIKLTIKTSKRAAGHRLMRTSKEHLNAKGEGEGNGAEKPGKKGGPSDPGLGPGPGTGPAPGVGFLYKYLKMTCKHYGEYTSSSKGIRPNQKTLKLRCPTFMYGCLDAFTNKFLIKQMVVNCNHELKDEDVLLPKILSPDGCQGFATRLNIPVGNKKYKNRDVLKIPLDTPRHSLPLARTRFICEHISPVNEIHCMAYSMTNGDYAFIEKGFRFKSRREQNQAVVDLMQVVIPFPPALDEGPPSKRKRGKGSILLDDYTVRYKLPKSTGGFISICRETFQQTLDISNNRLYQLIVKIIRGPGSVGNISGDRDFECSSEEHITSSILEEDHFDQEVRQQLIFINALHEDSQEDSQATGDEEEEVASDFHPEVEPSTCVSTSVGPPSPSLIAIKEASNDGCSSSCFLSSYSWSRQENKPWASDPTQMFYKVDSDRSTVILSLYCGPSSFTIKAYNQEVNCEFNSVIKPILKLYQLEKKQGSKGILKVIMDRINSLSLCPGIKRHEDKRLRLAIDSMNHPVLSHVAFHCFYSDSIRSKKCNLFLTESQVRSKISLCIECLKVKSCVN